MVGWAEDSLREAIERLARGGRNDIASDLNRLLTTIDFQSLEVMRNPAAESFADEVVAAASLPELVDLLKRLASLLGVDHCTINKVTEAPSSSYSTRAITTYPDELIMRYVERNYVLIDPILAACKKVDRGFFWDCLDDSHPMVAEFWQESAYFNVGPSGYAIPIDTDRGDRLMLAVSSNLGHDEFREAFSKHLSDLDELAIYFADAFSRLASTSRPKSFAPSDDQLRVLYGIAAGEAESDLRGLKFDAGDYDALERSICALFQTRTVAQAAVLAAKIGLLDRPPLTKADVLIASDRSFEPHVATATAQLSARRLARMRSQAFT